MSYAWQVVPIIRWFEGELSAGARHCPCVQYATCTMKYATCTKLQHSTCSMRHKKRDIAACTIRKGCTQCANCGAHHATCWGMRHAPFKVAAHPTPRGGYSGPISKNIILFSHCPRCQRDEWHHGSHPADPFQPWPMAPPRPHARHALYDGMGGVIRCYRTPPG